MTFQETFQVQKLHSALLKAIEEAGYTKPTPIQEQAIPLILEGRDLRACSQTGSGKTCAFTLPMLNKLATPTTGFGPRALILVPTRELAMQVANEVVKYSKHLPKIKTVCIYGGTPYPIQNRQLSRPYDILVATPGRLIDHLERGRIKLNQVELFILDEADRMLDMGFIEPVIQIADSIPKTRQTLLFSATLKGSVLKLSQRLLKEPVELQVNAEQTKHENIEQKLLFVDDLDHKHKLLDKILTSPDMNQAIIFTSTKRYAEELYDRLAENGHKAGALHGDMNQRERSRTMKSLREGKINVLIATDVACRGIDVLTISHVINFDLPQSAEDYVHRIGRTGRAGSKGVALSFARSKDRPLLSRIEKYCGHRIPTEIIAGMEPKTSSSQPRKKDKRAPFFRKKAFRR